MSLWTCLDCTTRYAVGLPACPHCRSTSREEDGMPKTTAHGGPSIAGHVDASGPDTVTPEWVAAPAPVEAQTAPEPVAEPDAEDTPADEPVKQPSPRPRGRTRKGA